MALLTLNGFDVLRGTLRLPRIGRWTGEFKVDAEDAITGPVSLVIGDGALTLNGTVARGGEIAALASVQVIAGANGLGNAATPRHYVSTGARVIVSDLLRGAGEVLSATADQSILGRSLPAWTTAAIPAGRIFKRLLARLGAGVSWRVLPDGSFWVGTETWPDSGLTADDVDIIEQDDEQGFAVLGLTLPTLLPGTLLFGQRVSYIEYAFEDSLRAKVWYEDAGATSDRVKAAFDGSVAGALPDIDYGALYLAAVVSQSGGTVDVQPDDGRLPSMGRVPLLTGLPQTTVDGTAGGRVLVGWSGHDPSRPYAVAFDASTSVQTMTIAVLIQLVLGDASAAEPFLKALSFAAAWSTLAGAFAVYLAGIKTVADPLNLFTPAMLTALTTFTAALESCATLKVSGT